MSDSSPKTTWPAVIAEAAKAAGMSLPQATQRGMGSVLWRSPAGDRFVSFRPLLGMPPDPNNAEARWSLWHDENDRPRSALVFHLPLRPVSELAPQVASVLQGWLLQQWSDQAAEQHVTAFAKVEIPPETSEPVANEVLALRESWVRSDPRERRLGNSCGHQVSFDVEVESRWQSGTFADAGAARPILRLARPQLVRRSHMGSTHGRRGCASGKSPRATPMRTPGPTRHPRSLRSFSPGGTSTPSVPPIPNSPMSSWSVRGMTSSFPGTNPRRKLVRS